ncbi:MAG: hypothetical protein ABIK96_09205 [bacterium]
MGQRIDRRAVHDQAARAADPELEDVPAEPPQGNRRHRFPDRPTADWTALQILQAFPLDTAPRFLIGDRDGIYGGDVVRTLENLEIGQKVISARSPWQNGYCERVVGTLKLPNTTENRDRRMFSGMLIPRGGRFWMSLSESRGQPSQNYNLFGADKVLTWDSRRLFANSLNFIA